MQNFAARFPERFDSIVKDNALRLLLDYSSQTGRKWTAIRNEIISVSATEASKKHPLLTRQDLESWAMGRSQLGDHKFLCVYKFLTHPETLSRPEFSGVDTLLSPRFKVLRVGRVLGELYGRSATLLGTVTASEVEEFKKRDHALLARWSGLYVGEYDGMPEGMAVYLRRVENERFFLAHVLFRTESAPEGSSDWLIQRLSGFGTGGFPFMLHVCDPFQAGGWSTMYLEHEKYKPADDEESRILLLSAAFVPSAFALILRGEGHPQGVNPFSVEKYSKMLTHSNNKKFLDIVANIEWNVPV